MILNLNLPSLNKKILEHSLKIESVPHFLALNREDKVFESGANKPLLIRAYNSQKDEYGSIVVKLMDSERMNPMSAGFEVMASLIAHQWELAVPLPCCVEISKPFIDSLRGDWFFKRAENSIGLNFGSIYIPGLLPIRPDHFATQNFQVQAKKVFSFDFFIDNIDRSKTKPNCLTDGQDLIIFDHELAFAFVLLLFSPPYIPWDLPQEKITKILLNSFLFEKIKSSAFDEDKINQYLARIDDEFWDYAFEIIPSEWISEQLVSIRKNLSNIVAESDKFTALIKQILQ